MSSSITRTLMSRTMLWGMIFLLAAASAHATKTFQPTFNPRLTLESTLESIEIDGELGDRGWVLAEKIFDFSERYPGDNSEPEVNTSTYVTYDQEKLYIAFVCHDDPEKIRATMSQRDQFYSDDAVGVLIDTYGDASWAYEFYVNPYGVQKDNLWSSVTGADSGFDLIWEAAAKVTDSGYQVELAVPFASMRFPDRETQTWKMDFWRNRPRETFHQYSWAAYDRNEQCRPCQWGEVNGISSVSSGAGVELLTTWVGNQSTSLTDYNDPGSDFKSRDIEGELSFGGKYSVSSDVTIEATYNPDFSQIEADAARVDVNSTIALFYGERRPFFQEGADVFRTLFNSFYTRTVNDPSYAVKVISRKPGLTLGFMSARDENTPYIVPLEERSVILNTGKSYVNVLRGSRTVGESSQIGFLLSDRRFEGSGYGSIVAFDGDIRLTQNISIDGQFLASFTGEDDEAGVSEGLSGVTIDEGRRSAVFDGESFQGNAFISRLKRFARHWSFMIDYNQVDPSYRTQTGFDPLVNYRNASIWTQYTFYPEGGLFERIQPQIYTDARWLYDGTRRWEHQNLSLNTNLRWAQTGVNVYTSRGSEAWTSRMDNQLKEYTNTWEVGVFANSRPSDRFGYGLSFQRGRSVARFAEAIGNDISASADLSIKPIDRLVLEPRVDFVQNKHVDSQRELFRQFIARTRIRLQVNKELSIRLVVQYDNSRASFLVDEVDGVPVYYPWSDQAWNIDPLISYQLSPFSVLYAGSSHDYSYYKENDLRDDVWKLGARQFFIKLQYLLQI